MLYLVEAKSAALEASRKLNLRLQGAMIAAEEQAFTDTLTGLKNRRAFDYIMERQIVSGHGFALMQIDLDFLQSCKRFTWTRRRGSCVANRFTDHDRRNP